MKTALKVVGFTYVLWLFLLAWFFKETTWFKSCEGLFAFLIFVWPFVVFALIFFSNKPGRPEDAYTGGSCKYED